MSTHPSPKPARWMPLAAALLLAGCAGLPTYPGMPWADAPSQSGNAHLDFLLSAQAADGASREALWQQVRNRARGTPAADLHIALVQSLEGHSGYDLAAAERRLRALRALKPAPEIDAVARLRLTELQDQRQYRQQAESVSRELNDLKRRLAQLIEIERHLDGDRAGSRP
ncbi:MAG: hypothetical protein Q8Q73_18025 [Stagnimonas sp.]|nr:hypothetical protein [Stagnimonas sp.]